MLAGMYISRHTHTHILRGKTMIFTDKCHCSLKTKHTHTKRKDAPGYNFPSSRSSSIEIIPPKRQTKPEITWQGRNLTESQGEPPHNTHTKHTVHVMYQTPVADIQDTRGRKVALLCYLISWYCCYEKHQLVLAFIYIASKEDLCEYQSCGELWPEAPCLTTLSPALLVSQQGGERGASSSSKYIKNENK